MCLNIRSSRKSRWPFYLGVIMFLKKILKYIFFDIRAKRIAKKIVKKHYKRIHLYNETTGQKKKIELYFTEKYDKHTGKLLHKRARLRVGEIVIFRLLVPDNIYDINGQEILRNKE